MKMFSFGRVLLASTIVTGIAMASVGTTPALADTSQVQSVFQVVQRAGNTLSVRKGVVIIEVAALRDDVFRIRIGRDGTLPRDESWAALESSRNGKAEVRDVDTSSAFGLATRGGSIQIDRISGAISVENVDHTVILADAPSGPFAADGKGFQLTKLMSPDLHIFGLGDKLAPLDRRGYVSQNWNTDAYTFQERQEPLYKDIPFFIGYEKGHAYGVFMDNTWRSVFDFGAAHQDRMTFGAAGGAIDYYVMTGPTPKDVVSSYTWLTGRSPMPPRWMFGFQQSRYSYPDEKTVRAIAARLRRDRLPADVIWFDIGFQDHNRPFTVDGKAFPHFKELIADLARDNFHSVIIADLHVAHLPDAHYAPYDLGAAQNAFVHRPDGSVYVGPVWPGPAVFPDFTDQKARGYWGKLFRERYVDDNVAGFWNDMNEPSIFTSLKTMPNDNVHHIDEPGFRTRDATHEEMHNVYGMENGRATYEGLLKLKPDQRPFVMMRASYAGGQRYATTWTGDNTSTWNHLRLSTPQLLSLGLSGFAYAGDNLGGFVNSPSADLLTAWLELGMFNPIAEDHTDLGTRPQEPWVDGKTHEDIRRRYIEERYRLLPYIYTVGEEASRTGIPMMRPLFLEFPGAGGGLALDLQAPSEFMWGASFLVAPSPFPEEVNDYKIILPPGAWYDYWSGQKVENATVAEATGNSGTSSAIVADASQTPHMIMGHPKFGELPVFVKAGSIVPREPLTQSTEETPQGALQLSVYANDTMSGDLYTDDGKTFDFRKGQYFRQHFDGSLTRGTLALTLEAPQGQYRPWWKAIEVTIYGVPTSVKASAIEGAKAENIHFDSKMHAMHFTIPYQDQPTKLSIAMSR